LKRLQSLDAELIVLRARTEAAMTRIEYRLNGAITVGDAKVSGEGVLRLDEEKLIGLGELGELRVIPGVSDLSAQLSELASLGARHTQLLQALSVASLGEAEARHEQWKALVAQQKSQAKILEVHAPQGIDALRAALASAAARLQSANGRLVALPDVSAAPPLDEARRNADIARDALEKYWRKRRRSDRLLRPRRSRSPRSSSVRKRNWATRRSAATVHCGRQRLSSSECKSRR
jgi:hypothetical protein